MPDYKNGKKKKASASPEGKSKVFTAKKVKSDPDKVLSKSKDKGRIRGVRTKAQQATEKDHRMQGARDDARAKEVKKAGGTDAYLKKHKKTKANLIKYKGKYVRKDGPMGKKAMKERDAKKRKRS